MHTAPTATFVAPQATSKYYQGHMCRSNPTTQTKIHTTQLGTAQSTCPIQWYRISWLMEPTALPIELVDGQNWDVHVVAVPPAFPRWQHIVRAKIPAFV